MVDDSRSLIQWCFVPERGQTKLPALRQIVEKVLFDGCCKLCIQNGEIHLIIQGKGAVVKVSLPDHIPYAVDGH